MFGRQAQLSSAGEGASVASGQSKQRCGMALLKQMAIGEGLRPVRQMTLDLGDF
jgi:hypothetical protein